MIIKMKFLKIVAPVAELDHVLSDHILKYEVQIENAVAELGSIPNLTSHNDINPYKELIARIHEYTAGADTDVKPRKMSYDEAKNVVDTYENDLKKVNEEKAAIKEELAVAKEHLKKLTPFAGIHYDPEKLNKFEFIRCRFGRVPVKHYKVLKEFLNEDACSIFCECSREGGYVWGIYFAPESEISEVDAVFTSNYFETIDFTEKDGYPDDVANTLKERIAFLEAELPKKDEITENYKKDYLVELVSAEECLKELSENYEFRKQFAFVKSEDGERFIACIWMQADDADKLIEELKDYDYIKVMSEGDEHEGILGGPPIKLKNPKFLKPFQLLIEMYGYPDYKGFDPTLFVALSYTIIFGMMFGDVGQGLLLFIGGLLMYKIKKMNLAAVISVAGFFSTIFGFLFGSIFGYEEVFEALWLKPTVKMTELPLLGRMQSVLVYAILLGMIMVLITMVLNIINSIKAGEFYEALFDHNGVTGLVFYGAVVACVLLFVNGKPLPGTIVLIVMFILPLILIILKEPLIAILFRKKEYMPEKMGIFFGQMIFELFEIMLGYFSNTLSFIRVGGFAISHASMMGVIMMLAGAENGGVGNIAIVIIGNIVVCALEGLIVGIQVMRLEYYEMFSRFYRSGGREFKPYTRKQQKAA